MEQAKLGAKKLGATVAPRPLGNLLRTSFGPMGTRTIGKPASLELGATLGAARLGAIVARRLEYPQERSFGLRELECSGRQSWLQQS